MHKLRTKLVTSSKLNALRKLMHRCLNRVETKKIIFIFGCQRSGTTLLQRILALSPRIKMHGEGEPPYFYPEHDEKLCFRLRPRAEVLQHLQREENEFTVIKPLYETQNLASLGVDYPNSVSYFIFRHYKPVIKSHLRYYKNLRAKDYLRPLFENHPDHWMTTHLPQETRQVIDRFSLDDISDVDAYALYWFARNTTALSVLNDKVTIVSYDDLKINTQHAFQHIFGHIDIMPKKSWQLIVSPPKNLAKKIAVTPEIEVLCEQTLSKLQQRFEQNHAILSHAHSECMV